MGVTFKPVFNHAYRTHKKELYPIHIRVTVDRLTKYLNPKIPKIRKEDWLGKENKWVKDTHPNHYDFNKRLQEVMADLLTYTNRLQLQNRTVTHHKIQEYFERRGDKTMFNDYVKEYNRTYKFQAVATKKKYVTFSKLLDEFNPNIRFSNIEEPLLLDFRDFLINEKNQRGTTVEKYFDPFKRITKDAVRKDYMPKDPFEYVNLRIKKQPSQRVTLTQEEIQTLVNCTFDANEKHLEINRDVFVFQCYTGIYYSDVKCLSEKSFEERKGKLFLIGNRYKTNVPFIVPLFRFPLAMRMLNKHEGKQDEIFPTITEQAYNRSLKVIAEKAGIAKQISNKVARHAFGDHLAALGIPEIHNNKFMGHIKGSKAFKHYYEITMDSFLESL